MLPDLLHPHVIGSSRWAFFPEPCDLWKCLWSREHPEKSEHRLVFVFGLVSSCFDCVTCAGDLIVSQKHHQDILIVFSVLSKISLLWGTLDDLDWRMEKHVTGGLSLTVNYICLRKRNSNIKLSSLLKLSPFPGLWLVIFHRAKLFHFYGRKSWFLIQRIKEAKLILVLENNLVLYFGTCWRK